MKNKIATMLKFCFLCGGKTYYLKGYSHKSYYCTKCDKIEIFRQTPHYKCGDNSYIFIVYCLPDVSVYISYYNGFLVTFDYDIRLTDPTYHVSVNSHLDGLKLIKRYCNNLCLR